MGTGSSKFTREQLNEYQELTFLTPKEIVHCWKRFYDLAPDIIDKEHTINLPQETILLLPELMYNPFRYRVCKVFSTSGNGDMTFEDFLDMMSVFSENAPIAVKIEYAFRIYDFDDDDFISKDDIRRVLKGLCGQNKLTRAQLDHIVEKIMEEADLDEDNQLNFSEFQHVIEKAPDFVHAFRFRM